MISDVLSEAVSEIRPYQSNSDIMYADLAKAINVVAEVMDSLRHYFDTPPFPFLHDGLQDLQMAIAGLDLSEIRTARQKLTEDWRTAGPRSVV